MEFALPTSAADSVSDDSAAKAWRQVTESAAGIADRDCVMVECDTTGDASRLIAAAVACSPHALSPSAGGITLLTVSKQDRTLQQIACLNHCGHL